MMKISLLVSQTLKTFIALIVVAPYIGIFNGGHASAATCVSWTGTQPANPSSTNNSLASVAVLSPCNAWAAGYYFSGYAFRTLIEHWNGSSWKQVPSANPGGSLSDAFLNGVRAVSATNIWAVGSYSKGNVTGTLIEHWNGIAWTQVASPNPGLDENSLEGLRAISATNIWAVGSYNSGNVIETLIEHWNGTAWKHVASPSPSAVNSALTAVAASSSTDAWAVGSFVNSSGLFQTLVLHWNGTAWKRVASPSPGVSADANALYGVAAVSASNAWAVGYFRTSSGAPQTLILHWNGTAWKQVASPNPSSKSSVLDGVRAISASNIWAVGYYFNGTGYQTLVEHWNGTAWTRESSPNPGGPDQINLLLGIGASSASDIWVVGHYTKSYTTLTLAIHCC
jgi:hypothetical protein